jgi:rare lipoprotein A
LSGKHAIVRTHRPSRKYVPLVAAIALALMLVAGAVTAMNLGPTRDAAANHNLAAASGSASQPGALPSRSTEERSSRSGLREMPSPSPSVTASPSTGPTAQPSTKSPSQPSSTGTVSNSGTCGASYYTTGTTTANGEPFDTNAFTAAHKTLPFNTRVIVTNTANGKSVTVRINDRGPFVSGRCLDLTRAAFSAIASINSGVITVRYQVLS